MDTAWDSQVLLLKSTLPPMKGNPYFGGICMFFMSSLSCSQMLSPAGREVDAAPPLCLVLLPLSAMPDGMCPLCTPKHL